MRILLLHDYGTPSGGAELMALALRDGLRAHGHEALLFTSSARPLPLPIVSDVQCFGTVSPARRLLQVANVDAYRRFRSLLREFRPDVVHVKMFLTQLSPLVLPLLRGHPAVLHTLNYNLVCPVNTKTLPSGAPCRQRAGAVCRREGCMSALGVARHAVQARSTDLSVFDRIIANSRWVADRLGAEGIRVDACIPNGVPVRAQRPPLDGAPLIAFAGRLVEKKGVDVLLRAMPATVAAIPAARLVIVGDGPERSRLESLTAALGVGDAVDFLGHLPRDDAERTLARAWAQAVPSRWEEPFGLVAAEAMMRGTAVVATGPSGLAEQVIDGETGYLVPPSDEAALARMLAHVLGDRAGAERLGAAGRLRALDLFGEDRHVESVLGVFRELVGGEPPKA